MGHLTRGRSSGSYPNSGFSDSVSGFCKLFLKLKKSNGFSDSASFLKSKLFERILGFRIFYEADFSKVYQICSPQVTELQLLQ